MIHAIASQAHYVDHITPILDALPDGIRGEITTPDRLPEGNDPVVVAGYPDLVWVTGKRPVVYVEHGAGQTYNGANLLHHTHPSYSGSRHNAFRKVALFICPNDVVAGRWNTAWPDTPAVAVGCPKLDRYHLNPPPTVERTVAWTWHWDCRIDEPEAGTALKEYADAIPQTVATLAEHGITVLGHAHPRWGGTLEEMWVAAGATYTSSADAVFGAAVLVADNTSLAPEFASLGKPVVWINSKRWRRHVNHGGRFWEWVDGQPQVDRPDHLVRAIVDTVDHPERTAAARAEMVKLVYSYTDGTAAKRAADAIAATVG